MGGHQLYDMHVHLGWFAEAEKVAERAARLGAGMLAVTVTPAEYLRLRDALAGEKNVALAAGLHPWWVRDARDADALCELLTGVRWVGEVGLDASPRRAATYRSQLDAFELVCDAAARVSDPEAPHVLSVHAVRAAGDALDVLERTGAAERCRCVLHWFSGTSEELWRAARLGCLFSMGERALATRRGREYARVLPGELLLSETDLPPERGFALGAEDLVASLERTVARVAAARVADEDDVRALLAANAGRVLLA